MATKLTKTFGAQDITFESGKLAMQAGGSVVCTLGETQVLATTTSAAPREGIDFFPLTVDVEERMYAAGKIPGGFFRREGRPSETAILTARLIDRPLRPTFRDGYNDDVQVVITVLSVDMGNPYDIPGINAASLSTMIAGLPFDGPVGAVRMGLIGGEWRIATEETVQPSSDFQTTTSEAPVPVVIDVHSGAPGTDRNGVPYANY